MSGREGFGRYGLARWVAGGVTVLAVALVLPRVVPAGDEVDAQQRSAIIDAVSAKLEELYVYPRIADQMQERLRSQSANGAYEDSQTLSSFLDAVNGDLLSVFPDGHLEVRVLRQGENGEQSEEEWWQARSEASRNNNFGFHRVERLPGNVGYIDLRSFDYPSLAGETLAAAMALLAYTDAMIIDLRQNPGGRGELSQILLSYFFEDHRVHYLTEQDGVRGITKQWWTVPWVQGRRRTDLPLYLLTSQGTGSAAEEFAFVLANLERATLVGETTAGAAHTTHSHTYPDLGIVIQMPDGRSYDPKTGQDWEGSGVKPHLEVPADQALEAAHAISVEALLAGATRRERRFRLEWVTRELNSRRHPITLDEDAAREYVGEYGPRQITLADGDLYYQRRPRARYRLQPLGKDWFRVEGLDFFRIRFERGGAGHVTTLVGVSDDGQEDSSERQ